MIILLVCCQISSAKDLYTVGGANSSSSDEIDLNTIQFSYISNRREQFWPYVESADSEWDWGINLYRYYGQATGTDFTGHHLEGVFGWHYSDKSYFRGTIGIHRLDVPSLDNQKDQKTYDLHAQFGITRNFYLLVNASEDYVYQLGLQPAAAREFLNAERWEAGFEWKPIESIRVSSTSSIWNLSDSNTRRENIARLLYGISPGWPWIWIGVSYEELEYDIVKSGYWTPASFRSVGLIFESSFPVSENLSGALSASLTNIKEDNNPEGNGGSITVGVDYKLTEIHTLRFEFNRILSSQQNSDWTENTYSLLLNGSF
ncbi:MAG: hypothetical protein IME94_03100 [Proteobacteria bacterium]|nr:hypothetical protein [Pseudomonadota bacterium]